MSTKDRENQTIQSLEAELIEAQKLEVNMKSDSDNNPVQKVVNTHAIKLSLYSDKAKIKKLRDELSIVLKSYVKNAHIKGRMLAKKSLDRYLEESAKRDITQKKLRLIALASEKQAQRRLSVSLMKLEKETNVLNADIAIFLAESKVAGLKQKEILKQLVMAAKNKTGIVQGFANRIKQINVAAVRRERSDAEISEYKKQTKPNEQWQWITVSSKPCPDCEARAGRVMNIAGWNKIGTPGSGRTICGAYCKCKLIPFSVAEDLFPTVKVFDWDEKKQVLTTASEARQLRALKNQAPQKTTK